MLRPTSHEGCEAHSHMYNGSTLHRPLATSKARDSWLVITSSHNSNYQSGEEKLLIAQVYIEPRCPYRLWLEIISLFLVIGISHSKKLSLYNDYSFYLIICFNTFFFIKTNPLDTYSLILSNRDRNTSRAFKE